MRRAALYIGLALIGVAAAAPCRALAAAAPAIGTSWATEVVATSARMHAQVDPEAAPTTYHFEYLTDALYRANGNSFAGAARVPAAADANAGAGSSFVAVHQVATGLNPGTAYRYRVVARNTVGVTPGPAGVLITQSLGGASPLLDGRGWEMVSPADKNGGQVAGIEAAYGGGDLQAAAGGGAVTFSSLSSFGAGGGGAPPASQYVSTRTASGWATRNVTPPTLSGSYGDQFDGVPYRLFSPDLARALMLDGRRCPGGGECPRSYTLRDRDGALLAASPALPELRFAAAAPDLAHVVFSAESGLYLWSGGALEPLVLESGAELAAPLGAISADGRRVYWVDAGGAIRLWEAGQIRLVSASEGAEFQVASADGSIAFYLDEGHLYRYDAGIGAALDLTPAGGVRGVLGAAANGAVVYYQDAAGLRLWSAGGAGMVAAGAEAAGEGGWPPATGTARVSADGSAIAFLSTERLTGYDNTDQNTGQPDAQLFLWRAAAGLACVSCNPTNQRPIGPASLPGAILNGSSGAYKPRALAANGARVFFASADALVLSDTNGAPDVYEWEANGVGGCVAPGGCVGLISSGRASEGAVFADASESGDDAYFLTARSLVGSDSGSLDLYDARVGGGFPEPPVPIPCAGDACQALPSEPHDPEPGTLRRGPGNPALRFAPRRCPKAKRRVKRHGRYRCVRRQRGQRRKGRHPHRKRGHRQHRRQAAR